MPEPETQCGGDGHGEKNRRKREHDVHDAHQNLVDSSSCISGNRPDRATHDGRDRNDAEGSRDRNAGAIDDAWEVVSPGLVGTEEMREARGLESIHHVDIYRTLRSH